MMACSIDTLTFPEVKESGKVYRIGFIPDEFETVREKEQAVIKLVKRNRVTDWIELGCTWGTELQLDSFSIVRIQQKLKKEKWYNGPIDGCINKQTFLGFQFYNLMALDASSIPTVVITHPKTFVWKSSLYKFLGFVDPGEMPNRIIKIKKALKENGYDVETIDGRMSRKDEEALREFQRNNGLKTNVLDWKTYEKLNLLTPDN